MVLGKYMKIMKTTVVTTTFCTSIILLTACSSAQYAPDPSDPLQGMNRATFSFNQKVDKYALKPLAQGYTFITPQVVRNRVTNFFSNIGEVPTFANDTLQGNFKLSAISLGRFVINTTVGLLGLFDPASSMGLTKHYNDFGITLAQYGITTSPYLVLPLIGPSSIRDALALYPNYRYLSLWGYVDREPIVRNSLFVLDVINLRASLLSSEDIAKEASLDEYVFMRDAYLQKRASLIKRYTGRDVGYTGKTNASDDPLDEYSEFSEEISTLSSAEDDNDKSSAADHDVPVVPTNSGNASAATSSDASAATSSDASAATSNNASDNKTSAENSSSLAPTSFRQASQDPVKQSIVADQLAEMN